MDRSFAMRVVDMFSEVPLAGNIASAEPIIIAELRRLEGSPSGAPYPYRKEKETHEWIFSWLLWLAVLLVGAYARRRRRRRSRATWRRYCNNRLTETQPYFIMYFFDTGHSCYD